MLEFDNIGVVGFTMCVKFIVFFCYSECVGSFELVALGLYFGYALLLLLFDEFSKFGFLLFVAGHIKEILHYFHS